MHVFHTPMGIMVTIPGSHHNGHTPETMRLEQWMHLQQIAQALAGKSGAPAPGRGVSGAEDPGQSPLTAPDGAYKNPPKIPV